MRSRSQSGRGIPQISFKLGMTISSMAELPFGYGPSGSTVMFRSGLSPFQSVMFFRHGGRASLVPEKERSFQYLNGDLMRQFLQLQICIRFCNALQKQYQQVLYCYGKN
jgi:hypothetical protein